MMRWGSSVVVTLLLLIPPVPAQQPERFDGTGEALLDTCTRYLAFLGRTGAGKTDAFEDDPFGMGYCAGLVRGVTASADQFHPDITCRLEGLTMAHAVRAVIQYVENTPSARAEADTGVVLRALEKAYFCASVR